MPVLIRIAFRNLLEHKSKTLIIGIIITIGIAVLVVGNSLMDTAALGIQRSFIDNYTGHVMISGKADAPISLFGVQSPGRMETTPIIPEFEKVRNYLSSHGEVTAFAPQVTGFSILSVEGKESAESRVFTMLFGIEADTYWKLFNNITLNEGKFFKQGEEGILISKEHIVKANKELKTDLHAGDKILLQGFGHGYTGFKIREVPITGIFSFKQKTEGLEMIAYVDIQTLRALQGMTISSKGEIQLEGDKAVIPDLSNENLDSLFSETVVVTKDTGNESSLEEKLLKALSNTSDRERALTIDTGAWNFILLKLKNPGKADRFIADLNAWFSKEGVAVQAGNWKKAAGPFATTADVMKTVFNVAIIIVAIVAIIIIMNTLVISVIERTSEIGTMRALGAQKSFVWKMFLLETLAITITFGVLGIILGALIIAVLGVIGIQTTNAFLQILFAGPVLKPVILPLSLLAALLTVIVIGIIAHLYPVWIALKIQPVKAIQAE
ncbi:MAG: FtsX-like permease family protein [Spirochaetota bacterium]